MPATTITATTMPAMTTTATTMTTTAAAVPLVDPRTGEFITDEAGGDAAYNRTHTLARGYGGTVQATARVGERESVLVVGAFADDAAVDFAGSGLRAGIYGLGATTCSTPTWATDTRYLGLFFHETIALADRFDVTATGRFNNVAVDIDDHLLALQPVGRRRLPRERRRLAVRPLLGVEPGAHGGPS